MTLSRDEYNFILGMGVSGVLLGSITLIEKTLVNYSLTFTLRGSIELVVLSFLIALVAYVVGE